MKFALLESAEGENDCKNDFKINLYESYVDEVWTEPVTPKFTVTPATHCTMELGKTFILKELQ